MDHAALDADWMRLFYNLDSAYGIDNAGDISKALKDVETLFKSYLDYLKAEKEDMGRYPGLKVGDINNPNNNAGNWE